MAGPAAPDARHDQRVGATQRLRVARDRDRRADARQRLVDAHQVARAVVDDRQPGRRAHSRTPLVEATPVPARVDVAGGAEGAGQRLEGGLGEVMVVPPGAGEVERDARRPRERFERVLDELERQAAGPFAAERQVDDGIRTAADVDDRVGERLVHRDRALPEPGDPGSIAERLGERRAEDEGDVLDRVVLVDLEVAVGADGQIEQAVVGERAEQVVVEPDARIDRPMALAVEPERDRDVGLGRGPGDRHATALARTDLDGAEWRGHPVASVAERGGDRDEPVVLVRVAHGQAQVVGERMAGTERARDEAASRGAPRPRSRRARRSRSRPAGSWSPTARPTSPTPRARRAGGSARRRRGRGCRRGSPGSRSASVTSVTDTVDTEPGGRYGLSVAISSRRATANPTRSPASA